MPLAPEYYIRSADSEESRGPFTLDQITSLVDASQVDRDTLYYDDKSEDWHTIESNEELRKVVFPEKVKLGLKAKAKDDMDLLNAGEDELAPVTVEDMLAAAEGDTEDTKHLKTQEKLRDKAAAMALPALGAIMALSAFNNLFPNFKYMQTLVEEKDFMILIQHPLFAVGIIDAFLALCLFLAVVEIYPMVRLRAAVGLGYLGFFHWAQWFNGDPNAQYLMITAIAGSLGVYVCTLTLNFFVMITFTLLGVLGMGGYAFFMFFA